MKKNKSFISNLLQILLCWYQTSSLMQHLKRVKKIVLLVNIGNIKRFRSLFPCLWRYIVNCGNKNIYFYFSIRYLTEFTEKDVRFKHIKAIWTVKFSLWIFKETRFVLCQRSNVFTLFNVVNMMTGCLNPSPVFCSLWFVISKTYSRLMRVQPDSFFKESKVHNCDQTILQDISHSCLIYFVTLCDVLFSLFPSVVVMFIMHWHWQCFWLPSRCPHRARDWSACVPAGLWSEEGKGPFISCGGFLRYIQKSLTKYDL